MKHDGYRNTYSLIKDGVNITLGPSDLRKEVMNNLPSRSETQSEAIRASEIFVVVVLEKNSENEVPVQMLPLLDEFADVV